MGTTLKNIADKAKVSQATVSLALNKKPGVSDATREKILQIAQDLEYGSARKELFASGAKGSIRFLKIATHGHTVNRDHDVFIADYIDGLAHGARLSSFNIEVASFRGATPEEIFRTLAGSNLSGVVVLGTELSTEQIRAFTRITIPLVFLDTFHDFIDFDFVDMNNRDAVYKIVTHLLENGHTEIGFVRSGVNTHNFELRDEGFHQVVKSLGVSVKESNIITVDSTYQGAYQDMIDYLGRRSKLPTALFCTNDVIAYGCIKALREKGYQIPDDVSVVGFDDLPLSSVMDPPLTTIQVPKKQMGEIAIARITQRIASGGGLPSVKVQVGGELVVRESVRNLAAGRQKSRTRAGDNGGSRP